MRNKVEISIAGRKFKIACPKGQESALFAAAAELNKRIDSFENSDAISTPEQAMMMIALNLSHDLLSANKQFELERQLERQEMQSKIELLQDTIEQAVGAQHNKSA